ncbi:MAG TPA: glycosyltransferase family 4 protein [Clostridiaceae bacterium]|nr:glycosyltransferase family 4 protein [Clostridiaceae bacterium]
MRTKWRKLSYQKVLFVRDSRELSFWAKQKRSNPFYRDWIFIFEAHSTIGLRPTEAGSEPVFIAETDSEKRYQAEVLSGLTAFDHVICVTDALTTALAAWSKGEIKPYLLRHASPLPRLSEAPKIKFGEKITIGYIGQISQYKGVNVILDSLRYLPSNFSVRIVGRFPTGESINSEWLDEYKRDPGLNKRIEFRDPVPIEQVASEIDACDILIQPASGDILNTNFEAPLKSFDYMVRGKPIVAADVPCHRELYRDGVNALLYNSTAEDLALKIKILAGDPLIASTIACGAWEQSVDNNYSLRAKKILKIIKSL